MRVMARVTIVLVSLSLVLTSGNPTPKAALPPTNQQTADSKAAEVVKCQNSNVQRDINDHYYFVPSMGRAGNDCNVTGQRGMTLDNRAKQLCHLTDFYLKEICRRKDMVVGASVSPNPCSVLPQLAKSAFENDQGLYYLVSNSLMYILANCC